MSSNKIGGWILIAVGALFLAHNFGLLSFHAIWKWWPVLLIALGASIVFRRGTK
jgi:hypothetical protein